MTKRQIFVLSDDLSGEESDDVSTVTFALDGIEYEIDLNDRNASHLREVLSVYVNVARRTQRAPLTTKTLPSEAPEIRKWARSQGIHIPARGRISREIADQFHAGR